MQCATKNTGAPQQHILDKVVIHQISRLIGGLWQRVLKVRPLNFSTGGWLWLCLWSVVTLG